MIILGIDPGTATVGYGLIKTEQYQPHFLECGVIETKKIHTTEQRLYEIGQDIAALLADKRPDLCVIEQLFFFRNVTNVITVAQARGVIIYEVTRLGIPIQEVTPLQMKRLITGSGSAAKPQVGKMIQRFLKLDTIPKPDDAADALGLALCGYLATRNDK